MVFPRVFGESSGLQATHGFSWLMMISKMAEKYELFFSKYVCSVFETVTVARNL